MRLSQLVTQFEIAIQPGQRWLVLGPEAAVFAGRLPAARAKPVFYQSQVTLASEPAYDGLLLAGALSAGPDTLAWLEPLLATVELGTSLVVIDWQADGLLDYGPELEYRFKRGKLCRTLRAAGFDQIQVMVDHPLYYAVRAIKAAPRPEPHAGEFVAVATVAELPRNAMKEVELFGQRVVVANTGGEIVAFARACPHAGQPLHRGKLRGRKVICPKHGYIWNVCTGEPIEPADEDILPRYPVRVEEGQIWVALADRAG
jgi:nitrite reductase/ring-hydroxylating ferredoxin subunit